MTAEEFMNLVYTNIAHGDAEHRKWLEDKCKELIPKLEELITVNEWDLDNDSD